MNTVRSKILLSILMLSPLTSNTMYRMQDHAIPLETAATAVRDELGKSSKYGEESRYYTQAQLIVAWANDLQTQAKEHTNSDIGVNIEVVDKVLARLYALAKKVHMQNDITNIAPQVIGRKKRSKAIIFNEKIDFGRHKSSRTLGQSGNAPVLPPATEKVVDTQDLVDIDFDDQTVNNETGTTEDDSSTTTPRKRFGLPNPFKRKSKPEDATLSEPSGNTVESETPTQDDESTSTSTTPGKKSRFSNPFKRKKSNPEEVQPNTETPLETDTQETPSEENTLATQAIDEDNASDELLIEITPAGSTAKKRKKIKKRKVSFTPENDAISAGSQSDDEDGSYESPEPAQVVDNIQEEPVTEPIVIVEHHDSFLPEEPISNEDDAQSSRSYGFASDEETAIQDVPVEQEDTVPVVEEAAPVEQEHVAPVEETVLAEQKDTVPVVEEAAPAEQEHVAPVEETVLAEQEDTVPVVEEAALAEQEHVAPVEETVLAEQEDTVPVVEEAAPAEQEHVAPVVEEAVIQEVPIVDEEAAHSGSASDEEGNDASNALASFDSQSDGNEQPSVDPQDPAATPAAPKASLMNQALKLVQNKLVLTGGALVGALYYWLYCTPEAIAPRDQNADEAATKSQNTQTVSGHKRTTQEKPELV